MLNPVKNPIIFLPYMQGEEWLLIEDYIVNNIRPFYYISSYGRIFSAISNRLMNPTIAANGYLIVNVVRNDETQICIYVHRTMMLAFRYVNGCEQLHVNHKDTNKMNNTLNNLEWMTLVENTKHAYQNGLFLKGEICSWSVLTDPQVHEVCKLYIGGYGITEISKIMNCGITTIFDIIHGKTRIDVSSNYEIIIRDRKLFTQDQVDIICKIFIDNIDKDVKDLYKCISIILGISLTSSHRRCIRKIYEKLNSSS